MEILGRKVHPVAEMFPLMEGQEFEDLVEDIRKNGLLRAIVDHPDDGSIVDGRNRGRACEAAGVEPRFETWDGKGDVVEFVISLNVRRRHLNESQRAMAAARLMPQIETSDRGTATCANLRRYGRSQKAATLLNVSQRSVQHALRVLKSSNAELIADVDRGKLTVSAAANRLSPTGPATPGPSMKSISIPLLGAQDSAALLWGPAAQLDKALAAIKGPDVRSEERRVGKECRL